MWEAEFFFFIEVEECQRYCSASVRIAEDIGSAALDCFNTRRGCDCTMGLGHRRSGTCRLAGLESRAVLATTFCSPDVPEEICGPPGERKSIYVATNFDHTTEKELSVRYNGDTFAVLQIVPEYDP